MDDVLGDKTSKGQVSILQDRESLLALYSEYNQISRFIVDKIWTNARFFTTLTSALLTLSITAFVMIVLGDPKEPAAQKACLFLSLLPLIVIILSWIGIRNLRREYERFLSWVTVRSKIQEKLGLYQEFSFNIFPEDKYLLPDRYVKNRHAKSKDFIDSNLKSGHSLYFYFRILQYTYIAMALLLIIVMLCFSCML